MCVWIIILITRLAKIKHKIYLKQWSKNTNKGVEAIVLLDLIQIINQKSRHIDSGSIKIYTDNQKNTNRITNKVMKVNYAQDATEALQSILQVNNTTVEE